VVQAAQTPEQAAAVVRVMAPSLAPSQVAQAVPAVMAAQSPSESNLVVKELLRAQQETKDQAAKSQKTIMYVVGGVLVLIVVFLLARKK
jgi:hypothetical protein